MIKFFEFKQESEAKAELKIYGPITSWKWSEDEVSAYDFEKELSELTANELTVKINSYGGEVADGLAIYNALRNFKGKVTTRVDGFACSIASVIFMAGDTRIMNESSLLMIHNAWTWAAGDSNAMKKMAEDLEKITEPSIVAYLSRINISREELKTMLDNETWLTPEECLEMGFCTQIQKESAKQSLEELRFYNLVKKTKELEKQLEENQSINQEPVTTRSFLNAYLSTGGNK